MKYCSKCGNSLYDDMLFCQKCGTKVVKEGYDEIASDVRKLKNYNLVLDPEKITSKYLNSDGTRASDITEKQREMSEEVVVLIKKILSELENNKNDAMERDVYTYVLKYSKKMCDMAAVYLLNTAEFKEFFDLGVKLVNAGGIPARRGWEENIQYDFIYKVLGFNQIRYATKIAGTLQPDVIYNNLEYQKINIDLVESYVRATKAFWERFEGFHVPMDKKFYEELSDGYYNISEGVPQKEIEGFSGNLWSKMLDLASEGDRNSQFYREMEEREESISKERQKKDILIADKKYWDKYPLEHKEFIKKETELKNTEENSANTYKKILETEKIKAPYEESKRQLSSKKREIKSDMEKLHKKVFGKKKAEEEIASLEEEMKEIEITLVENEKRIQEHTETISARWKERGELESQKEEIEKEMHELRNKQ